MSSVTDPSEQIDSLHKKVKDLHKQGKTDDEIIGELENEGVENTYAQMLLENVYNDIHDKRNFWKLIFGGAFFILGGLAINIFSYRIAENSNASYFFLFWGPPIAGLLLIIKAFTIFRK
jgi:hypothetical protein